MAVKFKPVLITEPGVKGGGKRRYFAKVIASKVITLEKISKFIGMTGTFAECEVNAFLAAIVDAILHYLIDGNIIRLGELGSLRLKLRSEGRDNKNDVDVSCIKDVCIVFTPGKRLKKMLKKIEYKKIQERKKKTSNK